MQVLDTLPHAVESLGVATGPDAQQEPIHRELEPIGVRHNLGRGVTIERDNADTQRDTVSDRRGGSERCQAVSARRIVDPEGRIAQRLGFGSDNLDDIGGNRCLDSKSPTHGYLRSLERRSLARLGQSNGCNRHVATQRRCDCLNIRAAGSVSRTASGYRIQCVCKC